MIPQSVLTAHASQVAVAELVEQDMKNFAQHRPDQWFYSSRVKKLDSFAQKIESGRIGDPTHLEDFFACMFVVPMLGDISEAEKFVSKFFEETYRKPLRGITGKKASDFVFDDIRLYGHFKGDPALPSSPKDSFVFEIQIKTFLQHAWSIATHDLVYKYDRVSWARNRVAYQVKALLEHAELAIASIEDLEKNEFLGVRGEPESGQNEIIGYLEGTFDSAVFPSDRRRMAINLTALLDALGLHSFELRKQLFESGRQAVGGHPDGWSPYEAAVDYSSRLMPEKLVDALTREEGFGIYVTPEVLRRLKKDQSAFRNALI
jgi:hypothetical protein